jgi:predicted nucleic acid-binding protein
MMAVIDVSGVAQILFQNSKKDKFEAILQEAATVLAPDLYIPELSNTLWKYCTKELYTPEECSQFIEDGLNYIDEYIDSKSIWKEVFGESVKNKHPVYDIFYAVIARRNDGILITNDGDLVKVCKKLNVKYCY